MRIHRKTWLLVTQIAIVAVPIAVLLFLGSISYSQTKDQLTKMALSRRASIVHLAALTIQAKLDNLKHVGGIIASQDHFVELIKNQQWLAAAESLNRIPSEYPDIDRLVLADPTGLIKADFPHLADALGRSTAGLDWYKEFSQNWQPMVSDVFIRMASPARKIITADIPIGDPGKILGILILQFRVDQVSEFSQWKIESELGSQGCVYVVDRKGNTVYHPKFAADTKVTNLSTINAVKQVLGGRRGIAISFSPMEQEMEVEAYEPVPGYNWGIVAQQPAQEAFEERDRTLRHLVALYGGLGLLVSVCTLQIVFGLRELWRQEEKFRQTVETTKEWFWACDIHGVLSYSNPAISSILAYSRKEVLGRNLMDFLYEEDLVRFQREIFPDAISKKTGWTNVVLRWNHKQGGICYLESNAVQVLDLKGRLVGFRGADRDITDRKLIEQQLEMSRDAALRSARAKSDFLAVMSHEIRTPLNGVIGMTSILSGTTLTDFQKDCLKTIKISGESLLVIINDILNFSKIESGRLHLDQKPFSLHQCVEETLDFFIEPIREKKLAVSTTIEPNVPESMIGDLGRLRQILSNLVSNAVKFTSVGQITLHIVQTKQDADGHHLQFSVTDTGIGISQDAIPMLFQSFQQVDSSATRHYGGTGLGLAISKRLAELMRGTMWVESEQGKGSTFYFTGIFKVAPSFGKTRELPMEPKKPGESPKTSAENGQLPEYPLRILLAEDNAINQKVLIVLLETLGYKADLVTNGVEVVEAIDKIPYDLILMDVQMPLMDGVEATRRIQNKMGQQSPFIVALTANALEGDREKFLGLGFDGYASKPLELDTLRKIIKKVTQAGSSR